MSYTQERIPSPTETQPPINILDANGLISYDLLQEHEGLVVHNLAESPVSLQLDDIEPVEGANGTFVLGIIDAAGVPIKIVGTKDADGMFSRSGIVLARGETDVTAPFDGNKRIMLSDLPVPLAGDGVKHIFGRSHSMAHRLRLDEPEISREHFSLSFDGETINIADNDASNGSFLITRARTESPIIDVQEFAPSSEFMIGDVRYSFEGVAPAEDRDNLLVFKSVGPDGTVRKFFIYRSNSEGSLRVSPGFEGHRYIKGDEDSPNFQYTQSSQLHPNFREAIQAMGFTQGDQKLASVSDVIYNSQQTDKIVQDFADTINTKSFPDQKLAELIYKVHAGALSKKAVARSLNIEPDQVNTRLLSYVEDLNQAIEASGIVPDFVNPTNIEIDKHPILGDIYRETFIKSVNGTAIEWQISHDKSGRIWIERIRFADTTATPYGTDESVVFSGILTSKPLEYQQQCTAIPESMKADINGYKDISRFLNMLSPVEKFRKQRGIKSNIPPNREEQRQNQRANHAQKENTFYQEKPDPAFIDEVERAVSDYKGLDAAAAAEILQQIRLVDVSDPMALKSLRRSLVRQWHPDGVELGSYEANRRNAAMQLITAILPASKTPYS